MIQILICDDEPLALSWIEENVRKGFASEKIQIKAFSGGLDLKDYILNGGQGDVLFLDINMPDIDGIFLARHLRSLLPELLLIFVTSKEDAVFQSFSAEPFRFIRKSRMENEISQVSKDVISALYRLDRRIVLQDHQKTIHLNPNKIIYIEASGKTQLIHYGDQIISVNIRLKMLEQMCIPYGFLKPHGSYLVNYQFIKSISSSEILLDNGESIPVSRGRHTSLKQDYLALITDDTLNRQSGKVLM